jgi:hypothetical protein
MSDGIRDTIDRNPQYRLPIGVPRIRVVDNQRRIAP